MELETSHLQYIVEHVFLPPKLPQSHDTETELKDGSLYRFVAHSSQRFLEALNKSAHAPSELQCWKKLVHMLDVMEDIHQQHQLSKEELKPALDKMVVGGMSVRDLSHFAVAKKVWYQMFFLFTSLHKMRALFFVNRTRIVLHSRHLSYLCLRKPSAELLGKSSNVSPPTLDWSSS